MWVQSTAHNIFPVQSCANNNQRLFFCCAAHPIYTGNVVIVIILLPLRTLCSLDLPSTIEHTSPPTLLGGFGYAIRKWKTGRHKLMSRLITLVAFSGGDLLPTLGPCSSDPVCEWIALSSRTVQIAVVFWSLQLNAIPPFCLPYSVSRLRVHSLSFLCVPATCWSTVPTWPHWSREKSRPSLTPLHWWDMCSIKCSVQECN